MPTLGAFEHSPQDANLHIDYPRPNFLRCAPFTISQNVLGANAPHWRGLKELFELYQKLFFVYQRYGRKLQPPAFQIAFRGLAKSELGEVLPGLSELPLLNLGDSLIGASPRRPLI